MRSVSFYVLPLLASVIVIGVFMSAMIHFEENPMDLPLVKQLPKLNLFEEVTDFTGADRDFRLVFIGDVHGQYDDLQRFIDEELGGLDDETTLVLLGDMVNKGPDSDKVLSFILNHKNNVRCVMGNHDLAVLFAYMNPKLNRRPLSRIRKNLRPLEVDSQDGFFYPDDVTKVKKSHTALAQSLGFETLRNFTLHCPVAMEIPLPDGQSLFAVHAGIVPGDFIDTTPSVNSVTEMKYLNPKNLQDYSKERDHRHKKRWYKFWKKDKLKGRFDHITVLYGHDANKGLNLHRHTKGMDTGCVKGGALTGFVYQYHHKENRLTHFVLQTDCEGYIL